MGFIVKVANSVIILCLLVLNVVSGNQDGDYVIQLFQEFVRINTTTNSDLTPAVEFWQRQAIRENIPISVHEFVKGYPVVVMKWAGTDSTLSSVMLNSHMDVVPADEKDGWKYSPFAAHIEDNGDIYGRGTQDMKCLSIQQFEALSRLKNKNTALLRDVYMTLMPDEETGGQKGMGHFIMSQEFADMKVGVELDEGWAQPDPSTVYVFAKDKAVWQFQVDCYGTMAHGSMLPPACETAVGKCLNVTNQLYKFREEQYEISKYSALTNAGAYTSVNLDVLKGGSTANVIPGHISFTFDVRLGTKVDEQQFLAQLEQWISNAGDNVTLKFLVKNGQTPATITNDSSPYWRALTEAAGVMNITLNPIVSTGATDGKYLRAIGIPAFGLSPMMNTPFLPHKVDERLNAAEFLRGLDVYEEIVKSIANIPSDQVSDNSYIYLDRKPGVTTSIFN